MENRLVSDAFSLTTTTVAEFLVNRSDRAFVLDYSHQKRCAEPIVNTPYVGWANLRRQLNRKINVGE